jgi:hypothetical protein
VRQKKTDTKEQEEQSKFLQPIDRSDQKKEDGRAGGSKRKKMIFSDLYRLQLLKEKNTQTVFERTLQIAVN